MVEEEGASDSDDAPIGPGAEEEAFIASESHPVPPPRDEPARVAPRDEAPMEKLDDLVARVPASTRKSLDELLRARFTRVRRLREGEMR